MLKKLYVSAGLFFCASLAYADRTRVIPTSTAKVERGSFARNDDGGWQATVCGTAEYQDGGIAALDEPCVICEAATFGGLQSACLTAFRAANTN